MLLISLKLLHTKLGVLIKVLCYRTLILSKLNYGAIVYGSARKSYLIILEPVANQALRICLGAYRTSPVSSLQVLAHEPQLELCREQLSLQYCTKLKLIYLIQLIKQSSFQPLSSLYRNKPNAILFLVYIYKLVYLL